MNGKYAHSSSLEGQLAAVAIAVMQKIQDRTNRAGDSEIPGVSDFEEAFRIHVQIKEREIRVDEQDRLEQGRAERRSELVKEIYILKAKRPPEFMF